MKKELKDNELELTTGGEIEEFDWRNPQQNDQNKEGPKWSYSVWANIEGQFFETFGNIEDPFIELVKETLKNNGKEAAINQVNDLFANNIVRKNLLLNIINKL